MTWQETLRIFERVLQTTGRGERVAVATVTHIDGSAYRRPGAKLLIEQDGVMIGNVSGGCLESDLNEIALVVMSENAPRLRHYDTGSDENTVWGLGLGCNGSVDVFVRPFTPDEGESPVAPLLRLLSCDNPFVVSTVVAGDQALGSTLIVTVDGSVTGSTGDVELDSRISEHALAALRDGKSAVQDIGSLQIFAEVLVPPLQLVICGAGDDAIPLAASASDQGFRVTVADHRPAYLTTERFPDAAQLIEMRAEEGGELPAGADTYVVIMTHFVDRDREWTRYFMPTEVPYIGILGPRSRTEEILAGIEPRNRDRIYGPVGLDIGAERPEQVALSIMAELLAISSGHVPRHLREKDGPIHDD